GWNKLEGKGTPSSSGKTVNFAMFVLDKLARREVVKAVEDQFSSPTLADNLADAVLRLVEYPGNGIFHTAGRSCISRYEFARKIAEIFGYPVQLVQPVVSTEFRQVAPRPRNSCLNVEKTEKRLGLQFLSVEEGLRVMKSQALSAESLA
ncbi:MAG TPA: sugar nucleotide-binding protein, partial [Candidatus Bathyarchaeia archaeon]|nr:sugar nucleotide-binding protein [Candidatus Bathyarchaeia archaeon]